METELKQGEEFWAEYTFEDHIRYVDLKKAIRREGTEEESEPYLREQLPHIRFTPYLIELTEQVVREEEDPLKKAGRSMTISLPI